MSNPNTPDNYRNTYEALEILNEKIKYWSDQVYEIAIEDPTNLMAIEWHTGLVMGLKHAKAILMREE